jgi:hypothetical protein
MAQHNLDELRRRRQSLATAALADMLDHRGNPMSLVDACRAVLEHGYGFPISIQPALMPTGPEQRGLRSTVLVVPSVADNRTVTFSAPGVCEDDYCNELERRYRILGQEVTIPRGKKENN